MAEPLLTRWRKLWARLGVEASALGGTGSGLIAAYQGMGRFYHNGTHLRDVLEKLDWARQALDTSGETAPLDAAQRQRLFDTAELALWYHDAVYDAKAKDNEAKSRELFLRHAEEYRLPQPLADEVAGLIELTAGHAGARTLTEKLVCDCDLSILGAEPDAFAAYDENIRKEYAHVPGPAYKRARLEVLKGFLARPQIFTTAAFRDRFEAAARANLARAVKPPVSFRWGSFR